MEEINDEYIINIFFNNNILNPWYNNYLTDNINNYLNNRFKDKSDNIREIFIRILLHIENRPVCPICGNRLKFVGKKNRLYTKTCGDKYCKCKQSVNQNKLTCLEKYGVTNGGGSLESIKKIKQTKLDRYGNENYVNKEKIKETISKRTSEYKQQIKEKRINTCREKYGVDYACQFEQIKEKIKKSLHNYYEQQGCYDYKEKPLGILKQLGLNNPFQLDYVKEKIKQTKLKRYGDENYVNPNKAKQTKIERYGNPTYFDKEKSKQTCREKYGVDYAFQSEQIKEKISQTCLKKYNSYFWASSDIFKEKISYILQQPEVQQKRLETCKQNNSYNKSQPEDECYEILKERYPDIIRQYTEERYPFNCDFYIPSKDLFIEYNGSQYHQKHPFNENDENDIKILEELKEKSNNSNRHKEGKKSQYDIMIETWTIRDVNKRNIAKQNKLNYIEFWNLDEVKLWLQQS